MRLTPTARQQINRALAYYASDLIQDAMTDIFTRTPRTKEQKRAILDQRRERALHEIEMIILLEEKQ